MVNMNDNPFTNDSFLLNIDNARCKINSYGAILENFEIYDNKKGFVNVALKRNENGFREDPSYAGAILGPCAGRISHAAFMLDKTTVKLTQNEGKHHIHGGPHGLSHTFFSPISFTSSSEKCQLSLRAVLSDQLDGYPGNRTFCVTYTLEQHSNPSFVQLRIDMQASTDADTYVDMSSHIYWNLNGTFQKDSGLQQYLQLQADRVLYNDASHIPFQITDVTHTPFDFRKEMLLADYMKNFQNNSQLKNALGYNNGFLLNNCEKEPAAILKSRSLHLTMELFTDQPAIVLYSGGYLKEASSAIALEASGWPDSTHLPNAPSQILRAGDTYHKTISFRFYSSDSPSDSTLPAAHSNW